MQFMMVFFVLFCFLSLFLGAELLKIECTSKDVRTQVEVLLEASKRTPNSASRIGWHPELKLLRILQATDEEDEENQPSGTQSEESLEA